MKTLSRRAFLYCLGACAAPALLSGCGAEFAARDSGKRKIAMVFDAPINDGGWGSSCYEAMIGAAKVCGWETACSENVSSSDWLATMQAYIDMGYDLIYASGNEYQDTVFQVAKDNPGANFCVLNGTKVGDGIEAMLPDALQIGVLAGALAGMLTKTDSIGFVGGLELDTTLLKLEGYTDAAQKVNPAVKVTTAYAGSFNDAAKGKEIASSMMSSNNVDVMFGDASVVDAGVREAMTSHPGTYNIGQPNDAGGPNDPLIANSVVTDNVVLIVEAMRDVESGVYGNKTIYGDISNGGISMGTWSSIVPDDVRQRFETIVEQVKAGTF